MANSQAIATSFKVEILKGLHALGTSVVRAGTGADTVNAALFLTSGSLGAATTSYSVTSEVSGSGYSAGGVAVTNATAPNSSGTTAFWTPSATISFGTVTLATAFNCVQLYNATQSNRTIMVLTFGDQTVTAGAFSITMPTNDATTGLLRVA